MKSDNRLMHTQTSFTSLPSSHEQNPRTLLWPTRISNEQRQKNYPEITVTIARRPAILHLSLLPGRSAYWQLFSASYRGMLHSRGKRMLTRMEDKRDDAVWEHRFHWSGTHGGQHGPAIERSSGNNRRCV